MFAEFQKHDSWSIIPSYIKPGIAAVGELVAESHRFTLDRASVMMIQNMSLSEPKSFVAALGICRLPFPSMWIEFNFRDRADWLEQAKGNGVKIQETPPAASAPSRLGFHLEEMEREGQRFIIAQPAWTHRPPAVDVASKAILIDVNQEPVNKAVATNPNTMPRDPGQSHENHMAMCEMAARVAYVEPPWMEARWNFMRRQGPLALKRYEDLANYDLAAEWKFLMAMLIVLNSRNIVKWGETENFDKLNASRRKKGKAPLLTYAPIKLALSKVQKNRIAKGYATRHGSSADPAWVIGHFKVRRTGVFWWSPHERGGHGAKPKEHRVTA